MLVDKTATQNGFDLSTSLLNIIHIIYYLSYTILYYWTLYSNRV